MFKMILLNYILNISINGTEKKQRINIVYMLKNEIKPELKVTALKFHYQYLV